MGRKISLFSAGIIFLIIFFELTGPVAACTTGLASGSATRHGRPLLWKNRDSGNRENEVAFFRHGDTWFLGIINADDTTQVWAGVNNHGFAIMNAESLDMAVQGEATEYDDEGYFMKAALLRCRTIDDFEMMLRETNSPGRKVTSNFGAIDALGAAAFFETGNHEYFRFDASDTPDGFLVRANFATQARSEEGYGKIRFQRAAELFGAAARKRHLDARYVIGRVSPDVFLESSEDGTEETVRAQDTVNRFRSVAAAIFEGAHRGENREMTTFWCTLGEPAASVSIPLWTYAQGVPALLDSPGGSSFNQAFRELKDGLYPGENPQMLSLEKLRGLREELDRTQAKIFRKTRRQRLFWNIRKPSRAQVAIFQEEMARLAMRKATKLKQSFISD